MPALFSANDAAGRKASGRGDRPSRACSRSSVDRRSESGSESMLFDMDMGSSPSENGAQSSMATENVADGSQLMSSGAGCSRSSRLLCTPDVTSLAEEVELLLMGDQENGSMSAVDLARGLALKGYHSDVVMERSRYSKYTLKGPVVPFRPFVLVTGHSAPNGTFTDLHLIIDTAFRAKFQVAQPSSKYAAMIDGLQDAFVGEPDELKSLVTTLAGCLKKEFADKGMSLPPWRSAVSLLSIWFPLDGRRFMCVTPDVCSF